jgi:protein SCO1/2
MSATTMTPAMLDQTTSEQDFAACVQNLIADFPGPDAQRHAAHGGREAGNDSDLRRAQSGHRDAAAARAELVALLREAHPVYRERGSAAITRMRGWVLLALERVGVTDDELVYVLEELDNGHDAYLVAAAARALRSYARPQASFVPVVQKALATIRYSDEAVTLHQYSGYAFSAHGTTAARELRATQRWLKAPRHACCSVTTNVGTLAHPTPNARDQSPIASVDVPLEVRFEDQDRTPVEFTQFFRGKPTVVAFFYTRCNNPQKCSLTVSKLGRLQDLLRTRGLSQRIRTAAITYDPAFDLPHRLRAYAHERGVRFDADHRVLRATEHWDVLRAYFDLGVNFIGSIVNRHRIEVFVLDAQGRIAASFKRLQWNEEDVLAQAAKLLQSPDDRGDSNRPLSGLGRSDGAHDQPVARSSTLMRGSVSSASLGTLAAFAAVFFPKCAMCWTAYLSVLGIAGLERIPYAPWLLPIFIALMVVNIASLWPGPRGDVLPFALSVAGAQVILVLGIGCEVPGAAPLGLVLSAAGSFLAVKSRQIEPRRERDPHVAFAQAALADPPR